jgi:hypothetical protein
MKPAGAKHLQVVLCPIAEVRKACAEHHRHLPKVLGGLVGLRVEADGVPVAWGLIGRPVNRHMQDRGWVEFTRGIVPDNAPPNCASALLGFAARWAKKSGRPVLTYTLASEPGTSLEAAGWQRVGHTRARKTWASADRDRELREGVVAEGKVRWVPAYCVEDALLCGFDLTFVDKEAPMIGRGGIERARVVHRHQRGLEVQAYGPGPNPTLTAWGEHEVSLAWEAVHLSEIMEEDIMFRDKTAPGVLPFDLPGAEATYGYGFWTIKRAGHEARAAWYGDEHTWYISSPIPIGQRPPEWDIVGHIRSLHPFYENQGRHVTFFAAQAVLRSNLGIADTPTILPFPLPPGGQAMRLVNDQSILIFHPKRGTAFRILASGETQICPAGEAPAGWQPHPPLAEEVVCQAWGLVAAPSSPAVAWELGDSSDPENPVPLSVETQAEEFVVVMDLGGEISVYSEDADIDYEELALVDRWSIYVRS